MFIVSKALLISSATVIVRAGEAIWLNPFATVLFNFRTDFSSVFVITERRIMGLYEVPLSMSLLGFGMGTMLANFHMCGIMLVLRAVFNMLVRNASPGGPVCFRCLMRSLSVFICTLFYCRLNLSCGECDVISLYFMCCSGNGSVCLVCCVFDIVCELFGETISNMFGCGCYFVVECYRSNYCG